MSNLFMYIKVILQFTKINYFTSILKNIRFLENLNTQFYKVYKKVKVLFSKTFLYISYHFDDNCLNTNVSFEIFHLLNLETDMYKKIHVFFMFNKNFREN